MKICIVSDSHDRGPMLAAAVEEAKALGAEAVLHCGDIESPDTVRAFKPVPTHFVYGNWDKDKVKLSAAIKEDPADRATLEEEHALELRTRDRERKLLKKVESALGRIDDGSYGYCEETGEPIGIPRLLARPTATLTIEAQERRELKQRMYGE